MAKSFFPLIRNFIFIAQVNKAYTILKNYIQLCWLLYKNNSSNWEVLTCILEIVT
jgi:hypothetical protein